MGVHRASWRLDALKDLCGNGVPKSLVVRQNSPPVAVASRPRQFGTWLAHRDRINLSDNRAERYPPVVPFMMFHMEDGR
jgi:hypothetical protein